jgi:hypothetical protein
LQTFVPIAAVSGQVAFGTEVARVYAFQGGSTAFWAYDPAGNTWSTLTSAPGTIVMEVPLPATANATFMPSRVAAVHFIATMPLNNVWSDAAVADLPAAASVTGVGASLVFLDGFIYAFPGNTTNQFWRYSVNGNSWTQLGNTKHCFGWRQSGY